MEHWNAKLYDKNHDFVSQYGKALLELVNTDAGQRIWDLGCGTGILSDRLARSEAYVIGSDLSPDMIATAKSNYPHLDFLVLDATEAAFENEFDTVFSNAVFHWIPDQKKLLNVIYRALRPSGKLIVEMGAKGNIAQIEQAFSRSMNHHGWTYQSGFFFPSVEEYTQLLQIAGFHIDFIQDFDRPTPFSDGKNGMKNWLIQFFADNLASLPEEERAAILEETEKALFPILWKSTEWIGDYRRLRFSATKLP